ncbi:FAD-dependent monooxygenase [Synechococcus sp. CC9311]|uniref:FAD-dependent monooxygenase n=1 Tax=Synechococcus sp. (strain CC9311) TaxID=64471 RepID=UPI0000DDADB8|nr:FAD-dependent monooxygenase [Synechococcus sp. CC9311]ABI45381.1 putative 2-octaprenyl-6-methoxyphenol hydroxylase [Synechococcus sp. CC9311]
MTGYLAPIRINGAGPTGSLLAIGLANFGYPIHLFDPLSADQICSRSRAYALTHSSRRLLTRLGLWNELFPFLSPFKTLSLEDRGINQSVNFTESDLHSSNRSSRTVGWILDHAVLMKLLMSRLERSTHVELHLGEASYQSLHSTHDFGLVIAADGPRSPTRTQLRFPWWSHSYSQGCLTAKVRFRDIDSEKAFECFRPEGPLAILPLGNADFQVVWSAPLHRCRQLAGLQTSAFLDQLCTILPHGLEPDALLDSPAAFPLEISLAPKLHRDNVVLVGESGHRCHPVGGQGLNLCWRDVETLLQLLTSASSIRRGLKAIPRRYTRRRYFDLLAVGFATDLLVRLFSNRQLGLLLVRRFGLFMLKHSPLIRRVSLQAMSDGPCTLLNHLPE